MVVRTRVWPGVLAGFWLLFPIYLSGCGRPHLTTGGALALFNAAGPELPDMRPDQLPQSVAAGGPYRIVPGDLLELRMRLRAETPQPQPAKPEQGNSDASGGAAGRPGAYRVTAGDVIEFQMPGVLRRIGEEPGDKAYPYACRVTEKGSIWLPIVGEMPVAGKTIASIEAAVIAAYFPKFVKNRPSVIARVAERASALPGVVGAAPAPASRDPFAEPIACRVSREGMIRLPFVGEVAAAGKTQAEVEAAVAAAYHPEYLSAPPTVIARVAEYRTAAAYATGAVASPGRYELRSNEMELAVLLAKAGGIGVATTMSGRGTGGAKIIRIRHASQAPGAKPVEVPVRDRNIPIANVALQDGDTVEVEHLEDPLFTVTGLVMSPGVHSYPPTARYTLQQALAMSGGIDTQAGPRYATVYRKDAQGKTIAAEFKIGSRTMVDVSEVIVKPGDVICLEHSFRTRWNKFWATVLHFGAGAYATVPIVPSSSR